eukprot:scaffold51988_cov59-Phaeocystis_antarctica.AAC.10
MKGSSATCHASSLPAAPSERCSSPVALWPAAGCTKPAAVSTESARPPPRLAGSNGSGGGEARSSTAPRHLVSVGLGSGFWLGLGLGLGLGLERRVSAPPPQLDEWHRPLPHGGAQVATRCEQLMDAAQAPRERRGSQHEEA